MLRSIRFNPKSAYSRFVNSVGDLFVDINYTTFDDKGELLQELLRSRYKCDRCKDIFYEILPPKIVQLYSTSDPRKHKRGKYENGNRKIKTANDTKLKNGFELHRKFVEAVDYVRKIARKRFPLN